MALNLIPFTHAPEMANNWESESNKALVSHPSTITLDSFASPTSLPNGSGLWYRSLCLNILEITDFALESVQEWSQNFLELRELQPLLAPSNSSFLELDILSTHDPIHHIYNIL